MFVTKFIIQLMLYFSNNHLLITQYVRGCPCGVMVKAMDCGIVLREFVLQSLGKGMNPLILPAMG